MAQDAETGSDIVFPPGLAMHFAEVTQSLIIA
jgi:hypothetical protein